VEHFEKAAAIFAQHRKFDALANVYLDMGISHERAADTRAACRDYERSLESHRHHLLSNPGLRTPASRADFEAYVAVRQRQAGCAEAGRAAIEPRLDAAAHNGVVKTLAGYKASSPLASTLAIHTLDRGRFYGAPVVHERRSRYVLHADGLWDISSSVSGPRTGRAHTLSLCGLVDLHESQDLVSLESRRLGYVF
jgi:hypothetical protein